MIIWSEFDESKLKKGWELSLQHKPTLSCHSLGTNFAKGSNLTISMAWWACYVAKLRSNCDLYVRTLGNFVAIKSRLSRKWRALARLSSFKQLQVFLHSRTHPQHEEVYFEILLALVVTTYSICNLFGKP